MIGKGDRQPFFKAALRFFYFGPLASAVYRLRLTLVALWLALLTLGVALVVPWLALLTLWLTILTRLLALLILSLALLTNFG